LAELVASLRNQNTISVFAYSLTIQLGALRRIADGSFQFAVFGPPGVYRVLGSVDLASWSELEVVTNTFGFARFTDASSPLSPQKFYSAQFVP
jgi:hypothetical protein